MANPIQIETLSVEERRALATMIRITGHEDIFPYTHSVHCSVAGQSYTLGYTYNVRYKFQWSDGTDATAYHGEGWQGVFLAYLER